MRVAQLPVRVRQVLGGPVVVVEIRPGLQVGVDGDRVGDAQLVAPGLDVRGLLLEGVLGGVDADDLEPVGVVRLVKPFDPGNGALAVDARVRPEVDQGRSTALGGRPAVRVEPRGGFQGGERAAVRLGRRAVDAG